MEFEFSTSYVSTCTNGRLQLHINVFFPCSKKNLICLLKTIDLADNAKVTCQILLNNVYQYADCLEIENNLQQRSKLQKNIDFIEAYMDERRW